MPDLGRLRTSLNELDLGAISIQEFGEPNDLMIRLPQQSGGDLAAEKQAQDSVRAKLEEIFGAEGLEFRRTEFVGPQVGEELKIQGLYAVLFAIMGIMAYIWMRFEWQYSVAAIVALVHDAALVIGLFALTQVEFNLSTVAAILLVAGYSINDTVIIFDRIREELRKYKKMPYSELFNLAINKTLSRTIMTSLTTLLALIALYVFGGEVIQSFVYALIFGIAVGTYSSVCVASPLLLYMKPVRVQAVSAQAENDTKNAKA